MATRNQLSELDYLILALIGENFSSGYAIKKVMTRMKGSHWSVESGSIYRVIRRLFADGLIAETCKAGCPNRERTEYAVTERGATMLEAWLAFAPTRSEYLGIIDPLRTRAYFLNRLDPAARARVLRVWGRENKTVMAELVQDIKVVAEQFGPQRAAAYTNLLHLIEARQDWIREMLGDCKKPDEPTSGSS
jgi:DNA-binding PadR family transcriptional regulator